MKEFFLPPTLNDSFLFPNFNFFLFKECFIDSQRWAHKPGPGSIVFVRVVGPPTPHSQGIWKMVPALHIMQDNSIISWKWKRSRHKYRGRYQMREVRWFKDLHNDFFKIFRITAIPGAFVCATGEQVTSNTVPGSSKPMVWSAEPESDWLRIPNDTRWFPRIV